MVGRDEVFGEWPMLECDPEAVKDCTTLAGPHEEERDEFMPEGRPPQRLLTTPIDRTQRPSALVDRVGTDHEPASGPG